MLQQLGSFWSKLSHPAYDDDTIDRLNYVYTNIIILACALTILAKQYVGEPLQCWVPAQFKGGWEKYVENFCFVENTYWVPMRENIPDDVDVRETRELQYYQWVPFVLALQALLFYIPRGVWNMLNRKTGLQVSALIQSSQITSKAGDGRVLKSDPAAGVPTVARHLDAVIQYQQDYKNRARFYFVKHLRRSVGIYLTFVYLVVKLLFIVNVFVQFVILNWFLGPNYTFWGFEILRDLLYGIEWETSGHFPRVTLCDFEVRRLGNLHRWTVQCVLMLNMFNEKIYIFLWWWFLVVLVLTVINFVYWLIISLNGSSRVNFVRRYLTYKGYRVDYATASRFVSRKLGADGVFVLRLISDNAGDIVTAEIVSYLWNEYPEAKQALGGPAEVRLAEKTPLLDSDGK